MAIVLVHIEKLECFPDPHLVRVFALSTYECNCTGDSFEAKLNANLRPLPSFYV